VRLTDIGRRIARVPIDPRLARMILAAEDEGVAHEVTVIVAALTVQDPRERPRDRRQAADEMHARFADPTSDFLGLLRLWEHLEQQRAELSSSAFRRMCRREFLNHQRVREWVDLVHQLERLRREGEHRGGRNGHGDQDGHGRRRDGASPRPRTPPGAPPRPGRRRAARASRDG
jgi:ATP-dependent helicase HrpA